MVGVILAPGETPRPIENKFISSNDRAVLFLNFERDHINLQNDHEEFIRAILVPHYINQIEALGFSDKVLTLRPIGKASATGPVQHNVDLSRGRAENIGLVIKKHFDAQKGRGKFARNVEVAISAIAEGDKEERELLGPNLVKIPTKLLERRSNQFRSVILSMKVRHIVNDDDENIFCRQILNMKFKLERVPSNLLEQKLDEIQKKMAPELAAAVKEFTNSLKGLLKTAFQELLAAAEFTAPEVFILLKGIEFIVPSDIALLFEFKDSRNRLKRYAFTGSANKIDIDAIECFCQLLSVLKWLTRLPEALQEMEREVEAAKKKLNMTHEQIDKLKRTIDILKKIATNGKKIFEATTAPGSLLRKFLGDSFVDKIIKTVNAGKDIVLEPSEIATEFALVHFERRGVFDIFSFAGVARTETQERRGEPTIVALDFAARANQSLLGFQAHVILMRRFALSFTLGSHEQSNGMLFPAPAASGGIITVIKT